MLDDLVKKVTENAPPKRFDLDNLPFDPAVELMKEARKHLSNQPETEEDAERLGESRLYKAHHQSKALTGQTPESSNSQANTPKKTDRSYLASGTPSPASTCRK